jgi:phosphoglycerol transferase MdoB-like AlkP superfamily enzyme
MPLFRSPRLQLALWLALPPVLLGTLLRIALCAAYRPDDSSVAALLWCVFAGLLLDLLTACVACAPLFAGLVLLPAALLRRTWLRSAFVCFYCGALVFHAFVQWFFFEEFEARFNHVALDYVMFPNEVFSNIGESYSVPLYVALAAAGGALAAIVAARGLRGLAPEKLAFGARLRALGGIGALALGSAGILWALPAQWRADRVENELVRNGTLSLLRAFATASLDWHQYYSALPSAEARARAEQVLARGRLSPAEAPRAAHTPAQVVVVLEESFGSDFVGVLGHPEKQLTPCFDRWSKEGLLLTQLVANGNRTVRGIEGVLASFVPLPGDAILKRDKSEDIATLARVFAARGYSTGFFYGGYAIFDSMKSFLSQNGWNEFVEQPDFPSDAFRTAWGVADRCIFDALLERQKRARESGEKLFATLLSVSNHRPFLIPPESPTNQRVRAGRWRGVAYADECMGAYLDQLAAEKLLDDTLVLLVGDHGARVYGSESIPAGSYRIPALFLAPDPRWKGVRSDRLCSQIDLAPTLLALAGIEERVPFLGSSVLGQPSAGGRAFVQHNRDVGMLTDTTLVVLSLQKRIEYYTRSGRESDAFTLLPAAQSTPAQRELALDATAVFQSAFERYEAREYRYLPPAGSR